MVDVLALTPRKIEERFGITFGHIHHVDNTFGFDQRMPYATPVEGLYSCSAGCHPAGSVIGAAGHNAARRFFATSVRLQYRLLHIGVAADLQVGLSGRPKGPGLRLAASLAPSTFAAPDSP